MGFHPAIDHVSLFDAMVWRDNLIKFAKPGESIAPATFYDAYFLVS
jgi:hypothetical protein